MKLLLLVPLFWSCYLGPPADLVTPCGVGFHDLPATAAWQPSKVFEAEKAIMGRFQEVRDGRFRHACNAVDGYHVFLRPVAEWPDPVPNRYATIAGLCICAAHSIEVAAKRLHRTPDGGVIGVDASPLSTTLAHELAHAIQGCNTGVPLGPGETKEHEGWSTNGINDALTNLGKE